MADRLQFEKKCAEMRLVASKLAAAKIKFKGLVKTKNIVQGEINRNTTKLRSINDELSVMEDEITNLELQKSAKEIEKSLLEQKMEAEKQLLDEKMKVEKQLLEQKNSEKSVEMELSLLHDDEGDIEFMAVLKQIEEGKPTIEMTDLDNHSVNEKHNLDVETVEMKDMHVDNVNESNNLDVETVEMKDVDTDNGNENNNLDNNVEMKVTISGIVINKADGKKVGTTKKAGDRRGRRLRTRY